MIEEIISVFDNDHYTNIAIKERNNFQTNLPFKHAVIDNFLPLKMARIIGDSYPKANTKKTGWKLHNNKNNIRHILDNTTHFNAELKALSAALCSRNFLLFLETLSGINSLQADPYFMGGGAMATGRNGFLNHHVDYNYNQKIQAWRQLNFLLYLTENWEQEWEGKLQLLSNDRKKVEREIEPLFNRAVIFVTTNTSFHGQPTPLNCPETIFRNVFSAFYYTNKRPKDSYDYAHYTFYNNTESPEKTKMETSPYAELITEDYLRKKSNKI